MGVILVVFQMLLIIAWYVWPALSVVPAWLIFMPALWMLLLALISGTLPLLVLILSAAFRRS